MSCIKEVVTDIEDIVATDDNIRSSPNINQVLPRALRKHAPPPSVEGDSFIPGSQSVYVKTWGCSHNTSDGEYMAGLLAASGYAITESAMDAHIWLLNSCTVKGPSEDGLKSAIRRGKDLQKTLVVAGCVPQGQKDLADIQDVSVVGIQQIDRVVEVVEETIKGNTVKLFGQKRANGKRLAGPNLNLPKIRRNRLIEIIPINSGCLNHCTYCKTKHSRGNLASYSPDEIIQRAQQAFSEGVVEVWLTSEDTGAYGRDIDFTLPELLWQLVKVIPENCMLRIGMTNPPYIMEYLEDIAQILAHPQVYAFLHVPVQSGADPVLAAMKREYTVKQFRQVVDYLRQNVPGVTIATDIICGFPIETEEDFEETVALVKEYQFSSLFINQFYPRPGTPAAKMKRLSTQEVKRRSRYLTEVFHSYETYSNRINATENVLVTEISHDGRYYVGHTKYYEQVLVPKIKGVMGKMIVVVIKSAGKHYLMGEIVDTPTVSLKTNRLSNKTKILSSQWVWPALRTNKYLIVIFTVTLAVLIYRLPNIITIINKLYYF